MDAADEQHDRTLIADNVRLAVEQLDPLTDFEFGLNAESVAWVEEFIERQREQGTIDPDNAGGFVGVLGSFLGQSIIEALEADGSEHSAAWAFSEEHGWGIRFSSGSTAFPFAKVDKAFREGLEAGQSITSFYRISIEHVATGRLDQNNESNES